MKPKIIPRQEVAQRIADVLVQYAANTVAGPVRTDLSEVALRSLSDVFEQSEALMLIRLVADPRVRCRLCNAGVSYTRASGGLCARCATEQKAIRESRAM